MTLSLKCVILGIAYLTYYTHEFLFSLLSLVYNAQQPGFPPKSSLMFLLISMMTEYIGLSANLEVSSSDAVS